MKIKLIAPCGMNCSLCMAFLRDERRCPGCRIENLEKGTYCRKCIIKNCDELRSNNWKYCNDRCSKYPCQRLKNLDKRYRTKYGMSMLENLGIIQEKGIRKLLEVEKQKWIKDGKIFCVHRKEYRDPKKYL